MLNSLAYSPSAEILPNHLIEITSELRHVHIEFCSYFLHGHPCVEISPFFNPCHQFVGMYVHLLTDISILCFYRQCRQYYRRTEFIINKKTLVGIQSSYRMYADNYFAPPD